MVLFKALYPTATLSSAVVITGIESIPTAVFLSAELKVPVEEVPTNKLFVKFVPPSLKVTPANDPPLF